MDVLGLQRPSYTGQFEPFLESFTENAAGLWSPLSQL
jgi:hypothetical protein